MPKEDMNLRLEIIQITLLNRVQNFARNLEIPWMLGIRVSYSQTSTKEEHQLDNKMSKLNSNLSENSCRKVTINRALASLILK